MTGPLQFSSLPLVLDDDEAPFVLGITVDARPHVEIGGALYRRGAETYTIEWPIGGDLTLRAQASQSDGVCCVVAFIGPLLNEWWPILTNGAPSPSRPVLSAAATGNAVTMSFDGATMAVTVGQPSPHYSGTMLASMIRGGFTEENLLFLHGISLGVIKAALLAFVEYRTLVSTVPDIHVDASGTVVPLETLLGVAAEASGLINQWQAT